MDLIQRIQKFYYKWYLRCLLATELYMVEPWERNTIYVLFVVLFSLVWYLNTTLVAPSMSHFRKVLQ